MARAVRQFRAVCFDVFGIVAEITDRRSLWHKLFASLDIPFSVGRRVSLAVNEGIEDVLAMLGRVGFSDLEELKRGLVTETASVRLFPDVVPTLARMREAGSMVRIISNLAIPCGKPFEQLLGIYVEGFTFSCCCGIAR